MLIELVANTCTSKWILEWPRGYVEDGQGANQSSRIKPFGS